MSPCKDCGVVDAPCLSFCTCAKCEDEYTYEVWKHENKLEYAMWLSRNS